MILSIRSELKTNNDFKQFEIYLNII